MSGRPARPQQIAHFLGHRVKTQMRKRVWKRSRGVFETTPAGPYGVARLAACDHRTAMSTIAALFFPFFNKSLSRRSLTFVHLATFLTQRIFIELRNGLGARRTCHSFKNVVDSIFQSRRLPETPTRAPPETRPPRALSPASWYPLLGMDDRDYDDDVVDKQWVSNELTFPFTVGSSMLRETQSAAIRSPCCFVSRKLYQRVRACSARVGRSRFVLAASEVPLDSGFCPAPHFLE